MSRRERKKREQRSEISIQCLESEEFNLKSKFSRIQMMSVEEESYASLDCVSATLSQRADRFTQLQTSN